MRFVHELEKLVDDSLEELPVSFEESRVLSDNIHDIAGNDGLIVLSALHFGETQEVLDDGDEESLLGFLVHSQGDGANGPAEDVAVVPRPFGSIHLAGELLGHDVLSVDDIQVCQVDQRFPDRLVELDGVTFLDDLSDDLSFIVLDNQDFLRSDHLLDHDDSQVGQDLVVFVLSETVVHQECGVRGAVVGHVAANGNERVEVGQGKLLHFLVELLDHLEPVVEAYLENFAVVNLRYPDQVVVSVDEVVSVREVLDELAKVFMLATHEIAISGAGLQKAF